MCCCMPCEMRGCVTVRRDKQTKQMWNRQSEPCVGTNERKQTKSKEFNQKKMRRSAGESEQMLSAGRRDKQKEQERPHRPGDGGDELRGRTDPEMAVTSSATNM